MTRRDVCAHMAAALAAAPAVLSAATTPRPAPPFTVTMVDGTKFPLSKYAGKVCVVEFLFTTCQHCQHTAEVMSKLHSEYSARGLQPVGVAWNEGATLLVSNFVKEHRVSFPVGVASQAQVFEFLGYSLMTRAFVPQTAFIDRKGVIRYQSTPQVEEALHDEKKMRNIIEELLKEPGGSVSSKK